MQAVPKAPTRCPAGPRGGARRLLLASFVMSERRQSGLTASAQRPRPSGGRRQRAEGLKTLRFGLPPPGPTRQAMQKRMSFTRLFSTSEAAVTASLTAAITGAVFFLLSLLQAF